MKELAFVGDILSSKSFRLDPRKVSAIENMTRPVADVKLELIKRETSKGETLKKQCQINTDGWPNTKQRCSLDITEFWIFSADLSVVGDKNGGKELVR